MPERIHRKAARAFIAAAVVMAGLMPLAGCSAEDGFELVTFPTADGGKIQGALFKASDTKAVIFAHGAVFDKESWYPQAKRLQEAGVTALPMDFRGYGNSKADDIADKHLDVLGAVAYLELQGYTDIAVVGGSMGGAAVLRALAASESKAIAKAVLLAPAGGEPIASESIAKLFIVAEGDRLAGAVQRLYDASADPKMLHIYTGDAHAQHLFNTEHADDLTNRIVDFLSK